MLSLAKSRGRGDRKYVLSRWASILRPLVPRLKKVVYSTDWKEGKPQTRDTGISHAFKIVRLESYEDTLNNLRLRRTPEQEAALNAPMTGSATNICSAISSMWKAPGARACST